MAAAVAALAGNGPMTNEVSNALKHAAKVKETRWNISSVYKHVANHALQTKAECQTARLTSFVKPCLFRLAAVAEPLPYIISLTNIWQQFYNRCEGKKLKKILKKATVVYKKNKNPQIYKSRK